MFDVEEVPEDDDDEFEVVTVFVAVAFTFTVIGLLPLVSPIRFNKK